MTMKCKRLNEVIELLQPAWQKEPELNLMQFLQKLAKEAGYDGELSDLSDDILIYHLKMRDSSKMLSFRVFRRIMKRTLKPRCCAPAA
jgi:uncharacterized protein YihD (DUF1040 family)